eukprot:10804549-Ditylum_brightwellii.AAC.1
MQHYNCTTQVGGVSDNKLAWGFVELDPNRQAISTSSVEGFLPQHCSFHVSRHHCHFDSGNINVERLQSLFYTQFQLVVIAITSDSINM